MAIGALARLINNPEVWRSIRDQMALLFKKRGNSPEDMLVMIDVLRDQVDYLAGSADDADEAIRAQRWTKQLDNCEHAAQVLRAPGSSKKDRTRLKKKIKALSTEILNAFIIEQDEDLQKSQK